MQGEAQAQEERTYEDWYLQTRPSEREHAVMRRKAALLGNAPRVSVLLVVEDDDEIWIKASASSVLDQIYPHLELCICDNASVRPHVREILRRLTASDDRVRACSLRERAGRGRAYNEALGLATGEYVAILEPGDEVRPEALLRTVDLLADTDIDLVYTDEDEIDVAGRRSDPTFKPPWSPDLLLSTNYIGRLSVFRRSIFEELGGFRERFGDAVEHDLALRFAEKTDRIRHLPGVYYHRRRLPRKIQANDAAAVTGAVREALERREVKAAIEPGLVPDSLRIVRDVPSGLRVSIILMAGEATDEQRRELKESAGYPIHELLEAGFGGALALSARELNFAARRAEGEYLIFVDSRVTPVAPAWLSEMLSQAHRPEVGAVGGRLTDAGGRALSAGEVLGLARLTGEPEDFEAAGRDYLPLQDYPSNFPVAARWMAVRKSVFEDAGGFDDANLPTAFYDLDLGFRLEEAGLLNVYTPHAGAIYEEAPSLDPGEEEIAYMWSRWWGALVRALYYSGSPVEQDRDTLDTVLAASLSRAAR